MRKNTRQVLNAFQAGKPAHPSQAIWTDGESIYSYGTCIAVRRPSTALVFNRTRYSVTTTIHQNALLSELRPDYVVDGAPQGITHSTLGEVALNPEYRFFIEHRDDCSLKVSF